MSSTFDTDYGSDFATRQKELHGPVIATSFGLARVPHPHFGCQGSGTVRQQEPLGRLRVCVA